MDLALTPDDALIDWRCVCGNPHSKGVVHRTAGPCYVAEQGPDVLVAPTPVPSSTTRPTARSEHLFTRAPAPVGTVGEWRTHDAHSSWSNESPGSFTRLVAYLLFGLRWVDRT